VIDGLNGMTPYDAGGMLPPIDWTKQHTESGHRRGVEAVRQP
jgi:hypothetical protein